MDLRAPRPRFGFEFASEGASIGQNQTAEFVAEPVPAHRVAWPGARRVLVRAAVAGLVFLATLGIVAIHEHAPYDIQAGLMAQVLAGTVPLIAAAVAGYAVLRPWPAYLAVLLLTPYWDLAQVSWWVGSLQVIGQTLFLVALGLGCLLDVRVNPASIAAWVRGLRHGGGPTATVRVAGLALAALLLLAYVSTALSPDVTESGTVLLHGILEPVAMGIVLLALGPNLRKLALVAVVLGISVGLGGLLNMTQTLPDIRSLSGLQTDRLLFARLTYFNVGLFGEMLAMAMPLLLTALIARRRFGLGRIGVAIVVVAIGACLASLFLTFSKSAWLATAAGSAVLVLLVVRGWRRRAAIVLVGGLLSTAVIPWPAFVLQVAPPLNDAYRSVMVRLIGESRFDSWNPSTRRGGVPCWSGSMPPEPQSRWPSIIRSLVSASTSSRRSTLPAATSRRRPTSISTRRIPSGRRLPRSSAFRRWCWSSSIFAAALLALWRLYRAPPDELTRLLAAMLLAALAAWLVVATTFDIDLYRDWRNMSSDVVMMAVVTAAAFALDRHARAARDGVAAVPHTATIRR